MNDTRNNFDGPVLIDMEEEPAGLAEAWRSLFGAAWDAYDRLMERRRAAASTIRQQTDNDQGATQNAR